jgi:very-short-patch-repair endonuclease
MKLQNHRIRKQIKMRLIRKYRAGLIKEKTRAEAACEDILKRLEISFISQAGFLSPKSFYIVDFYIKYPYKLIVEINGTNHTQRKRSIYDKEKIGYLKKCGFRILRFSDEDVLNRKKKVECQLKNYLTKIKMSRRRYGHL